MIVTEVLRVDYVDCTPENPMQLAWINSLGGTDTWVFSKRQEYILDVSDVDTFQPIINYLQLANGVQRTLKKDAFMSIRLGYEQLNAQQVTGIKELLISPLVKLINGTSEIVVVVKDGTFKLGDVFDSKRSLEFEIILPKLYTTSL
tara:strand:- start:133 stop:570 length:438 start_codon:yes stop_codon:yes gene_type:complete